MDDDKKDLFKNALFEVEHGLGMYATSYCTLPAECIYDTESISEFSEVIKNCHIYLIGFVPKIDFVGASQNKDKLAMHFSVLSTDYTVEVELPDGVTLGRDEELYYLSGQDGERFWPDELFMQTLLCHESDVVNFEVKYIGQAYGKGGERSALDRLLKHETLQKIAVSGIPDGYQLTLLLLEIQPNNQLISFFNPFAENKDDDSSRIKMGLDKLFGTTERERIALYEASLIRYFSPQYNKEFKNSFPSTDLKILQDCYDKDFSAVVAEMCIDEFPFKLFSERVAPSLHHIARHDLHDDEGRRMFFGF